MSNQPQRNCPCCASYLVATPKRLLTQFQKELLAEVANHPQIQVKRIERDGELYVLTRSLARAEKERRCASEF
jgi:hypothetical protein